MVFIRMKRRSRKPVNFDDRFFGKQKPELSNRSVEEKFRFIYRNSFWNGGQSASGEGSSESQTETIRRELPGLLKRFGIRSILDIPCGDFHWMKDVEFNDVQYTGADVVDELIELNKQHYSTDKRTFMKLDLIKDPLPSVDLIFCRDCFVHLSNRDILKALGNIRKSNSIYLFTTTFTDCEENMDIITGDWRVINLQMDPFKLPEPLMILNENCTEGEGTYNDKSLGLWEISEL